MTQLESNMTTLRRLFEPWNTAPYGTVIWEPEASDPNAAYKRELIAKAREVIAAGDAALTGASFQLPGFGESSFSAIQDALAMDPEERDFIELAAACENVCRSLVQVAA
ncbi:hypothetical protein [Rhodanobacter denitrificans]|uniref:hypothetical protein n=1 Tax=Rhodanobacter denitrificans TaxID=666685 RepID=UPI001F38DEA7|nr:hypothetical protein [Rhodanobacter denitrificans]UJJ58015.1 hypothetical protein LRK55_15310 [Rhodanobacter denitrificans]